MARRRTTEGPLVVSGVNAALELLRSGAPVRRVCRVARGPRDRELDEAMRVRGVRADVCDAGTLGRLAGSAQHQGVVVVTTPYQYVDVEDLLVGQRRLVLVLDGVQDPRNLGAILRTARAVGVGGVVLPRDRSSGVTSTVVTTSAGLVFGLRIARVTNLVRALRGLRDEGFWLAGLVPRGGGSLYAMEVPDRVALVAGGEGEGLRALVRGACDFQVSLPMTDEVESLNVSVAIGVALYEIARRGAA